MRLFILTASERKVKVERSDTLVSDSVNVYPVKFNFTAEWRGLTKIAVFRSVYAKKVEKTIEILLEEDKICEIPWELLLEHGRLLQAGVYGLQGDNLVRNTIWVPLGEVYEGVKDSDGAYDQPEEPSPDIYGKILSKMGNLDELQTEDQSSLVNAINEVYNLIGDDGPIPQSFVESFNGRVGNVVPEKGDYTPDMIGIAPVEAITNFELEELLK